MRKLDEIEKRVTAMAGEPEFDPAYMYKSTFYDAYWMIKRIKELEAQLRECVPWIKIIAERHNVDETYKWLEHTKELLESEE